MDKKIRWLSVFLVLAMVLGLIYYGKDTVGGLQLDLPSAKQTLSLWYTDENLKDYIESAALAYQEESKVKVIATLVPGLEYVENINNDTIYGDGGPDLFIIGNDALEKASMAGLAAEVLNQDNTLTPDRYSQSALNAVTYHDRFVGYPLYFETSFLLYNRTLLEQMAAAAIQAERNQAAGEEAMDEIENNEGSLQEGDTTAEKEHPENAEITPVEIENRVAQMIPTSYTSILDIASNYDSPEGVETMFKWDISDVLYNYQFAGAYMNLGGPCGDNRDNISIYNQEAMYCLGIYQDLNQFFSIEAEEVSYNEIMDEFLAGKILFTIADTDCLTLLEQAKTDGSFPYEYGLTTVKMVNGSLQSKSLSATHVVALNGYGSNIEKADEFACFLAGDYSKYLYSRSGKVACCYQDEYPQEQMQEVMNAYANSVPLPKFVETANYWILAEMCYTNIWKGEDINKNLKQLSDTMKSQIFGEVIEDEPIETPAVEEDYNTEE